MPIIPNSVNPISLDVAGPTAQATSATGTAIANLGAGVADASLQLLDHVKQAEAVEASSKALFQDRFDSEDQIQKLKNAYPDGYVRNTDGSNVNNTDGTPRTITHEFREWANERFQKNQLAMPSAVAQDRYAQLATPFYSEQLIKVRNDELIQRTESFKRSQESDLQTGLNRLVQAPVTSDAYQIIDDLTARVKAQSGKPGSLLSFQDAFNAEQKIKKEVPQSILNGFVNSALNEPKGGQTRQSAIQMGMSVLDGTDPDSVRRKRLGLPTISDSMDPDQKAAFAKKFIEMGQIAQKMDFSDLERDTKDYIDRVQMGDPQANPGPVIARWTQAASLKQKTDSEASTQIGSVYAAQATSKLMNDPTFRFSQPEAKARMVEDLKKTIDQTVQMHALAGTMQENPNLGGAIKKEWIDRINGFDKKDDEDLKQDFAKAAIQIDPQTKAYSGKIDLSNPATLAQTGSLLLARSKKLESLGNTYFGGRSPDFRYITKDESEALANFLKNDTVAGGTVTAGLQTILKTQGPKYYSSIMDQMIRDGKLDPEWRVVSGSPSSQLMSEFVQTLRNGKIIRDEAEKVAFQNGLQSHAFDDAVQGAIGKYIQNLSVGSTDSSVSLETIAGIRRAVTTHAMDIYRQEGGARKPDEVAKAAAESWLGSQYDSRTVGGLFDVGSRTNINLPRSYNGQALTDQQRNNMILNRGVILSNDNLQKSGAIVPPGAESIGFENFASQVRSSANFRPTSDGSGFEIWYRDNKSNLNARVMSNKTDRNGKPIPLFIPMERMIQDTPQSGFKKPQPKGFIDSLTQGVGNKY